MDDIPHLDLNSFPGMADRLRKPYHEGYYAMYSSVTGCVVTDPVLMTIPLDDHMVHRGDGVFETFKCVRGNIYNLDAHLARLRRSAGRLQLQLPRTLPDMIEIVSATIRAGGRKDCIIRLFVSRGPGSLGVNPYDAPETRLYVIAAELRNTSMEIEPASATARASSIPLKHPFFASIKSCNYLPNVLMKKEAVDAGVDYVIAFNDDGHLAEAPTENIGIVTPEGELLVPEGDHILSGTTMQRVMALAKELVCEDLLQRAEARHITREQVMGAREVLVLGTTPDVVAVVEFDGQPIGNGRPGGVCRRLRELLVRDMLENKDLLTPVF